MKSRVALVLFAAVCVGCSDQGGMTPDQEKQVADVNAIAKASGGDWSKLTQAQQQELVKAAGSEGEAKQLLYMKGHGPVKIAPGRPSGHGGP